MKKIIIILAVILLAIAVAGIYKFNYLSGQAGHDVDGNKITDQQKLTFTCKDGAVGTFSTTTANDTNAEKIASLSLEGSLTKMQYVPSGSGEKYENTSESLVFWEKGDKAFIEKEGVTIHSDCELKLQTQVSNLNNKFLYSSVKSNAQCSDKGGYWYKNKCWKDYEDEGISESKIDSIVTTQMEIIKQSTLTVGDQTYPLLAFLPLLKDQGWELIAVYGIKDNYRTLVFPTAKKTIGNGIIATPVLIFDGDAIAGTLNKKSKREGTATVNIKDIDSLAIEISGKIPNDDNSGSDDFTFKTNQAILGAGNSHLEIKGNEAYLSGGLGTITYVQIKNLIKNKPEVKTIVMTHIKGSVNDAVNMHTGRLLRENGFTTKVLSNSDIASGGVDLFTAGKKRIVEKGAKIGVHSWCCVDDLTAIEIPKDHPAHQNQLEYFTMTLGAERGPDFYFYTLSASPFDSVHYMTDDEIKKWHIATDLIENSK